MIKCSSNHHVHPYLRQGFVNPIDERNQKPGKPLYSLEKAIQRAMKNSTIKRAER